MSKSIVPLIEERIKAFGFDAYAWLPLARPVSLDHYRDWLDCDYHGEMKYLEEHLHFKEEPQRLLPKASYALVVSKNYYPAPRPDPRLQESLSASRVALYAQNSDYHHWFKDQLRDLSQDMAALLPEEQFLPATDSLPILERDLAQQAGLGWVGKNTCLIHPNRGSLFFIGEILTTWSHPEPPELKPIHDFCGNCTRCLDICPTQALVAPRKLDARRCISYLTIESKTSAPIELRHQMGDWLFGCDLCQTVCPWNEKAFGPAMKTLSISSLTEIRDRLQKNPEQRRQQLSELRWILSSSIKNLNKFFTHSPLSRAGGRGLKRNAIVVATNLGFSELQQEIRQAGETYPQLTELSLWSLKNLAKEKVQKQSLEK